MEVVKVSIVVIKMKQAYISSDCEESETDLNIY